ncbi:MAG: hypothetical protein LBS25_04705, partial [Candidatus Symbiothrix sp.]|nr:hypothetical protein [Candidatus Symbiothrix sp.]
MKKNILFLLLPVLFATLNAQTGKRIYPLDDTYIFSNGGNENAVIRHLEDPNRIRTYTHQSDERWTYKSYLKFDLSSIHNDPDSIYSVV